MYLITGMPCQRGLARNAADMAGVVGERERCTRHEETGAGAPCLLPSLVLLDPLSLLSTGNSPRDQLRKKLLDCLEFLFKMCGNDPDILP
jgi:hypothetical protein